MPRLKVGQILVDRGAVSERQLDEAVALQQDGAERIGQLLCRLGHLDSSALTEALVEQANVPRVDFEDAAVDPRVCQLITPELSIQHKVLPWSADGRAIRVAMADPFDRDAYETVRVLTGKRIKRDYCPKPQLTEAIRGAYGSSVSRMIADLDASAESGTPPEVSEEALASQLQELAREPTIVNLVNLIIAEAIDARASDIHVEPFEKSINVKYRIDGVLHQREAPSKKLHPAIVSRIKIMSGMNIAERFVPQDGHINFAAPRGKVDIRVATVPTLFGECVVMRLLDRTTGLLDMAQLGLSRTHLDRVKDLLAQPHGILLVTGPTGSGTTTTLYGALRTIYSPQKKIITIEDPVEYELEGINQIPVNPKRGLDFANGLRAILRQDPDVIMVGEIRDRETADIAIRSALTGHLVFSTLHTNDAAGAVTRLIDMGIEPFLLASSLQAVLAQRLVRTICPACKTPHDPDPVALERVGHGRRHMDPQQGATFHHGQGCRECRRTGYLGRVGIFELLPVNENVRQAILARRSAVEISAAAPAEHEPMAEDGYRKAAAGDTTLEEVLRVTQDAQTEAPPS